MTTTILSLYLQRFGSAVKQNGNGFNGPCPLCGGEAGKSDRFMVWPERSDNLGHCCTEQGIKGVWWCRRCDSGGDSIAYLEQCEGMSFKQACAELGIEGVRLPQGSRPKRRAPAEPVTTATFTPREYPQPSTIWQAYAAKLVDEAAAEIWNQPQALAWLAARGIDAAAIRAYRIGYLKGEGQNAGRYRARTVLDLPEKTGSDGKIRTKIFIPRGITVPTLLHGTVVNLRIRRHQADLSENSPKYMELEGSYRGPLLLPASGPAPLAAYFVTEAELDAMLIHHRTGGVVGALAVRTNRGKPDSLAHPSLQAAARIGIALDYDTPGADGVDFWEQTYPASRRWPTPEGKDPGDAYRLGVDIREWIAALLPPSIQLAPSPSESTQDHGCTIADSKGYAQASNNFGQLDAFFSGQNTEGGGGEKAVCTTSKGQESAQIPTRGQIQAAETPSFTASEQAFLQAALPAYLPLSHVPHDVLRACLLWRGIPATFVHHLQGGGFEWRYSRTWARNNPKQFEAFWQFQDESTALWQWMSDHTEDNITCENLLHIWG